MCGLEMGRCTDLSSRVSGKLCSCAHGALGGPGHSWAAPDLKPGWFGFSLAIHRASNAMFVSFFSLFCATSHFFLVKDTAVLWSLYLIQRIVTKKWIEKM